MSLLFPKNRTGHEEVLLLWMTTWVGVEVLSRQKLYVGYKDERKYSPNWVWAGTYYELFLSSWVWRLIDFSNSLVGRVLEARYYLNNSYLQYVQTRKGMKESSFRSISSQNLTLPQTLLSKDKGLIQLMQNNESDSKNIQNVLQLFWTFELKVATNLIQELQKYQKEIDLLTILGHLGYMHQPALPTALELHRSLLEKSITYSYIITQFIFYLIEHTMFILAFIMAAGMVKNMQDHKPVKLVSFPLNWNDQ